ncbi:MAG: glycosyltransferase family 4 protein [Chloroflexi bacterium]|nr:glycosyltransferase family 4 protein [Chloroflexota bacterium]
MSDESARREARLDVAIVVPTDVRSRAGGIATFIRSFICHAPEDFAITVVGVTDQDEAAGIRGRISVCEREIDYLPVARISNTNERTSVPVAARFALGLVRHGKAVRAAVRGSVLQLHRPGSDLPGGLSGAAGRVRVLHTFSQQLTAPTGGSRWRRLPRAFGALEKWSLRRADVLIAVNETAAHEYRRRYPALAERIHFVPNWVELNRFRPSVSENVAKPVGAMLGIDGNAPLITVVGRLAQEKRPALALEAFAVVASRRPTARLLFIGDGPLRPDLVRRVGELGLDTRVHFSGVVDHDAVAKFLSAADVTVIPSAHETGPTTCLESLAAGVPVVATPVGQIPEWITNGRNGYVVKPIAEDIARAVLQVLDGDATRLRAEAVTSAEPYDARRVLALVYDLHRQADVRSRTRT